MLKRLVARLTEFSNIAGVEVVFGPDGGYSFNLAILAKSKKLISAEKCLTDIKTFDLLKEQISNDLPVSLNFSGKGVMVRKVESAKEVKDEDLLARVLPNAKPEEFFLDIVSSGELKYLMLLRKERVLEVISKFEEAGFMVIAASAGPSPVFSILPLIKKRENLRSGNFMLGLHDSQVTDLKQLEDADSTIIEIADEKVESKVFPAWSAAFHHYLPKAAGGIQDDLFEENLSAWKQKKIYQTGLRAWGIAVGLIVFLNLGAYFYLSSANNALSSESSMYASKILRLEELEKEVERKEQFLQSAGWLSLPKASFHADRIAASVPNKVSLTSMLINPHDEAASRKEKKPVFQTGKIFISGTCSDPVVLNPWLKELSSYSWVKAAGNRKYWYDHKKRYGTFEIELEVKE